MVLDFSAPISKSVRNVVCKERSDGIAKRHPRPSGFSHKCFAFVCPLAVPEKIIGRSALILDFFDRCAETTCALSAPGGAWLFRPTSYARRSHTSVT